MCIQGHRRQMIVSHHLKEEIIKSSLFQFLPVYTRLTGFIATLQASGTEESGSKVLTMTNLEYHVLQVIAERGAERVSCVRRRRSKDEAKKD